MAVTIITLVENTAGIPYVLAEWGQSILIETDGQKILFDTGPSGVILENAKRLSVDLSSVDKIVLSHGHYDHTGGLKDVLTLIQETGRKPGGIEIIAHPDIFQHKYFYIKGMPPREIGIPFSQRELVDLGARFTLARKPVQLGDCTLTTGEVEISVDFEPIEPALSLKKGEDFIPDPVNDDLGIIINTERGLVIMLGCAHRGAINTIRHAQKITRVNEIYAVIGGTHLLTSSKERLYQTIEALREFGITKLGTSHCTGLKQSAILATEFGDSFFFNNTGTRTLL
jgi:7,8-dihydropterin-6-yl-methyl-4-(beta-D-ribofuranosyl)aminobenzene 5'-phosphate synthase